MQLLELFYKKGDLKNFVKFTEKDPSPSLFLIKLQIPGLQLKIPKQFFSGKL